MGALRDAAGALDDYETRLRSDIGVLEDVGLGSTGRAEALRRILDQNSAVHNRLVWTAADLEDCGRTVLQEECFEGHVRHKPFLCNKPLCPQCAARRARRLVRIYTGRVAGSLIRAPRGVKARLVTLPYRPRDTEDHAAAFRRCRDAATVTLRACFGIPQTAEEWRIYFELHPITGAEYARVPEETERGRRRTMAARMKQAKAHRRRALKIQPARRAFGAIRSIEFGEGGSLAHGHALVVGPYVDQKTLSRAWQLATGGTSYIAHIRAVQNIRKGTAEVLKYMTKFGAQPVAQLVELYRATLMFSRGPYGQTVTRQRRRVESIGRLRGRLEEEETPAPPCVLCGRPMRVVGSISWELWQMGVRNVPEERRYGRRPREPD